MKQITCCHIILIKVLCELRQEILMLSLSPSKVVSDLLSAIDGGEPSALLSLDISAAFDTLDHRRLLSHAHELVGFSDSVLKWMQSYLSDH